jgi:integrase
MRGAGNVAKLKFKVKTPGWTPADGLANKWLKDEHGEYIRRESKNWYLIFYHGGRQIHENSRTTSFTEAKDMLLQRLGDKGKRIRPKHSAKLRYEDIREPWLDRLQAQKKAMLQTLANGTRTVWGLEHIDKFFAHMKVSAIDDGAVMRFRKARLAEGASGSTVNRNLSLLRGMMNLARKKKKYYGDLPDFEMTDERANVRKGFLEHADFEKLLAQLPAHLHTLLIFLYTVAVRLGEAQAVAWPQIDLKNRVVSLWDTKNGEWRTVPLCTDLVTRLSKVPTSQRNGAVFYQGAFRKSWITACIKCKLGHWEHPDPKNAKRKQYVGLLVHDLRRSAIRNMTLAGVPQNIAMAISGHKTIAVFLRYNIVAPTQLHTAMQAVELQQRAELQGQETEPKELQAKETKQLRG